MTLQNEKFEELIADQLQRELEPQRGRAAAAFQAQIAAEAAEAAQLASQLAAQRAAMQRAAEKARHIAGGSTNPKSWARKQVSTRSLLFWTGAPSLAAAALALAVTLHFTGTGSKSVNPINPSPDIARQENSNFSGGSPGTTVANMGHRPTLMPERSGVLIIQDPNVQNVSQNVYQSQPQPQQWTDPVDHMYRFTDKP